MGNREFEDWWKECGKDDMICEGWAMEAWQARQPEIDALKAEILQKSLEGWTEIQRLKAEVERLRKDAERYHALPSLGWYVGPPGFRNYAFSKQVLDEGVDAAMKETK